MGVLQQRLLWIVDDSHLDAERARAALAPDFEVEVFHDGPAVIERLAGATAPDVLLLDWLMPAVSGLDVLRYVRDDPRLERLSVLVLTALNSSADVVTALGAGANDFVSKPYSGTELRARVEALLRTRSLVDRAERAEAALRNLLDIWSDAVITLDESGAVTFVNQRVASLLQRPCGDVLGRPLADLVGRELAAELLELPTDDDDVRDVRLRDRVLEASLRRLADAGLGTLLLTLRDVTEQRRSEEERRDFYAIVAHDMRSPLFSMLLRTELLMDGVKGALPAMAVQELVRMKEQIRQMSRLLSDFLDLAKLSEASFQLDADATNLDELVRDVAGEFQPLLSTRELTWRHEGRHSCIARVDGARIRQAVMNLFVNAAKYTPAGGVITTSAQRYEDAIEISVEDTGPGIDEEEQRYVFDRYRRAHSAGKTSGSGLGLMIVRRVVEAHGGELGVDSRPGLGSRFWFRVPVDPAHPFEEVVEEREAERPRPRERPRDLGFGGEGAAAS